MKRISILFALIVSAVVFSQNTINASASYNWVGWMSVFDTSNNYQFGQSWGVADLKTVLDTSANTITLKPNYNTYNATDSYWSDGAGNGNKIMEAITYYEPGTTYNEQDLTFTGNVISNNLNSAYTATIFIKALDPANGYATVYNNSIPMPSSGAYSITAPAASLTTGLLVQVGYIVKGLNANPINEALLGSVVIGAANLSTIEVGKKSLTFYPNPVNAGEMITVKENVKSLEIFDMNGRKVKSATSAKISSQGLAKGMYMMKVTNDKGENKTNKVVIK